MSAFPNQSTRRELLGWSGMSLAGVALDAMISQDLKAETPTDRHGPDPAGRPHFPPRAKSVIWLMMRGGASHHEGFDPKPALDRYAGKTLAETPFHDDVVKSPYYRNVREQVLNNVIKTDQARVLPLQKGFRASGESGTEVSDWWPHTRELVDEMAVVRSMWTTDNNHGAQLQFHTGRHSLDGFFPTVGSWIHYGLGSLNDNLPQFIVMGTPIADCCGGQGAHGANYLGPEHNGLQLEVNPARPLPFATPGGALYREEQRGQFELLDRLNQLTAAEHPDDAALRARIKSYQLAYRMQMTVPEVMEFSSETKATRSKYGIDNSTTRTFGQQCLAARRMVERGVRFVQIFHGSNGGAGRWDGHSNLRTGHARVCLETDQPIAALIGDLKARGMLDETLVVWGTEFGRTPGAQNSNGRDHHPYGFSIWMAGGGLKGGIAHGATDELGFHATEHRHYITDVHATVMQQLGLDAKRLEIPGRKRLEIDYGRPIDAVIG